MSAQTQTVTPNTRPTAFSSLSPGLLDRIRERGREVFMNYLFAELASAPVRIVRVTDPKRPDSDYAVTMAPTGCLCSCPSFSRFHHCKHIEGVLQRDRFHEAVRTERDRRKAALLANPSYREEW